MPSSQVFCTASHFLLPCATRFNIFTAQTPVRCELTLRGAAWEIQVTPTHSSSSMDEDSFHSSRVNFNKRSEARLQQDTSKAKSSLLWKPPRHSLCVAAFSLQWISEKFQTQDLLVQYKTVYLGNSIDEHETSSCSHLKHVSFPRSPRQSTAASDNFISQFIWVWKCKLLSLLV